MNIIQNNPYRVLGVYSNAPKRELIGAENKIKAHVKIGKTISFKTDFSVLLGDNNRNEESLNSSVSSLTLTKDKIRYALFWFICENAFDEVAFNHLAEGNIDSTINILQKKSTASSYVNLAVCFIIKRQWANALYCYSQLLEEDRYKDFVHIVSGEEYHNSAVDFSNLIIDSLELYFEDVNWLFFTRTNNINLGANAIEVGTIFQNSLFIKQLQNRYINKICNKINEKISITDGTNRKVPSECLASAKILSRLSSEFKTLKSIIGKSDIKYTSLSDKVAEMLNSFCIGYYNNSSDYRRAKIIFPYVKDALSFACSESIVSKCQEGYDFVSKKIEELPPDIIEKECQEIDNHLSQFIESGNNNTLLNCVVSCQDILSTIKNKVGESNTAYIKQSSNIVHFVLNQIVDEVNKKQKAYNDAPEFLDVVELNSYKESLRWAKTLMDKLLGFAKDDQCKQRFTENNNTLISLYKKHCVVSTPRVVVKPTPRPILTPRPNNPRPSPTQNPRNTPPTNSKSSNDDNTKSVGWFIFAVLLLVLIIIIIVINVGSSSPSTTNNTPTKIDEIEIVVDESDNNEASDDYGTSTSIASSYEATKSQDEIWLEQYKNNSLKTGATPYRSVYGGNATSGNSALKVTAPIICDVLVIVKRGGSIVKHAYIRAGQSYTFHFWEGIYQPFFIFGNSWCPEKEAPNGQKGYFLEDVSISKDYPQEIGEYQELEYKLQAVRNGNFRAASSNSNEAF